MSRSKLAEPSFLFLFWAVVFMIDLGPEWHVYSSTREALEVAGLALALQMIIAAVSLRLLVPLFLDRGHALRFLALFLLTVIAVAEINVLTSYLYLEPTYPYTYGSYYQENLAHLGLAERMGFSYLSKYILLSKMPHLAVPAALLIAARYYRQQRAVLALRERQRASELDALKNQLNPHFIFNTLNNIYALALRGSEQTAPAVERLSNILDYVLYRGCQPQVALRDEVAMLESYIDLERLRFGDRLTASLQCDADGDQAVPPLLYLTLLENAFKHGVARSREHASVAVRITEHDRQLVFTVTNSIPRPGAAGAGLDSHRGIGLRNLRRQLELQCPGRHGLSFTEEDLQYTARLSLSQPCQSASPASLLMTSNPVAS